MEDNISTIDIPKVTLKQLYDDVFMRSSLIAIPYLEDFFEMPDSKYTKWQIFFSIVRNALRKFEQYNPAIIRQRTFLQFENGQCKLFDNFQAYLDGKIDAKNIMILPSMVTALAFTPYTCDETITRKFTYHDGVLSGLYSSGYYYIHSICNRPLIEDYNEITDEPTEKCAVYYMKRGSNSEYRMFEDQVYVELCRYIISMKRNLTLMQLPVDIFAGLEQDYAEVKAELDQKYQTSLTNSAWMV